MLGHLLALRAGQQKKLSNPEADAVVHFLSQILTRCLKAAAEGKDFWDGALPFPTEVAPKDRAHITGTLSSCLKDDARFLQAEAAYHPNDPFVRIYVAWLA